LLALQERERVNLRDEQTRALLNLLIDTIEADRYPLSPRIRTKPKGAEIGLGRRYM
jgi:hypothetical protein